MFSECQGSNELLIILSTKYVTPNIMVYFSLLSEAMTFYFTKFSLHTPKVVIYSKAYFYG